MAAPIPFYKHHALGNDYIVLTPDEFGEDLTADIIRLICHSIHDRKRHQAATVTIDPEMLVWKEFSR